MLRQCIAAATKLSQVQREGYLPSTTTPIWLLPVPRPVLLKLLREGVFPARVLWMQISGQRDDFHAQRSSGGTTLPPDQPPT